jgi:hypothetical protein
VNPDLSSVVKALDRLAAVIHGKDAWDYASTVLVGLTLVVLIWYTVETSRLRKAAQKQIEATGKLLAEAQRQNEIAVMPMFALYPEVMSDGRQRRIILENVGLGPAFNLSIVNPQWNGSILEIKHSYNVWTPKQTEVLSLVLQKGTDRMVGIDVDSLYQGINKDEMPNPLNLVVRCVSLHHTRYEFKFKCIPDAGYLKITFDSLETAPHSL